MIPRNFPEATVHLQRPADMSEDECKALPVYQDDGRKTCVSCWRPSWRERLSILIFGRVWLGVHSGKTQPPVWLLGMRDIFLRPRPQRPRWLGGQRAAG